VSSKREQPHEIGIAVRSEGTFSGMLSIAPCLLATYGGEEKSAARFYQLLRVRKGREE